MKYRISEETIKLREFGRNVQMMTNYLKKLEERDERNALARSIVRIMANINPIVQQEADYEQKLWATCLTRPWMRLRRMATASCRAFASNGRRRRRARMHARP
jgi:Domain of unknown function (DUF4290)